MPLSSAMNCVKQQTPDCACAVKTVNLEANEVVQAISGETKSYGTSLAIGEVNEGHPRTWSENGAPREERGTGGMVDSRRRR